jgi:phosphatidyl-myo-inositol dimannoside synthase
MKSDQTKVLGLFPYFGPEAVGGAQTSARIAWNAISNQVNARPILLVYSSNNQTKSSGNSAETLIVKSKANAVYAALSRRWSPHLVFVWHLGLLRLLPFLRLSKARVVVMLLGVEAWKDHRRLTRKQLEKVDLFLTISDHTWIKFVETNPQYKAKPHETILLGIGSPITEAPQPCSTPAALMVSRLSRDEDYKGHREVIKAWPRVLRRTPEAKLWIVGDGDLRSDLQRLVTQLQLTEEVRFWGLVSEETKQELLQKCRCLVMPSRAEGFGLVYLEAMRLGRPCLVSTLDAGREVVNPPETGLAADPDDQDQLVGAICELMSDGLKWHQWSERARRRYEQNFTATHFQDRLLAALFPKS